MAGKSHTTNNYPNHNKPQIKLSLKWAFTVT